MLSIYGVHSNKDFKGDHFISMTSLPAGGLYHEAESFSVLLDCFKILIAPGTHVIVILQRHE